MGYDLIAFPWEQNAHACTAKKSRLSSEVKPINSSARNKNAKTLKIWFCNEFISCPHRRVMDEIREGQRVRKSFLK
jgi:hypothetical protein